MRAWAIALGALLAAWIPAVAQELPGLVQNAVVARERGDLAEAIAILERAVARDPRSIETKRLLAETLAWHRDFARAEALYRELHAAAPAAPGVRLGLGRVLLWQAKYAEAETILREARRADPADLDVRAELGRAAYWQGDFRSAARIFDAILAADPARDDVAASRAEIAATMRPAGAVRSIVRSDDQPMDFARTEIEAILFSDPLTSWRVAIGGYGMNAGDSRSGGVATVSADVGLPRLGVTLSPRLRVIEFPDGAMRALGALAVSRSLSSARTLSAAIRQDELLLTAGARDAHPWVTTLELRYAVEDEDGRYAAARAAGHDFSDGNRGFSVDGYALQPVRRWSRATLSLGASAALRDTDESRFAVERVVASPVAPGHFRYEWEGTYDPYWTPLALREIRAIASLRGEAGARAHWRLQATAGVARDRGVSFSPADGPAPVPPFIEPVEFDREYAPWTASAGLTFRPAPDWDLHLDYEHASTVWYEADELRATLARRF